MSWRFDESWLWPPLGDVLKLNVFRMLDESLDDAAVAQIQLGGACSMIATVQENYCVGGFVVSDASGKRRGFVRPNSRLAADIFYDGWRMLGGRVLFVDIPVAGLHWHDAWLKPPRRERGRKEL